MEWEAIVNQKPSQQHNERQTRKKLYQKRAIISSLVALAFILTTFVKLMHPVLGESGMVIALCVAWYNLGRAKECAE